MKKLLITGLALAGLFAAADAFGQGRYSNYYNNNYQTDRYGNPVYDYGNSDYDRVSYSRYYNDRDEKRARRQVRRNNRKMARNGYASTNSSRYNAYRYNYAPVTSRYDYDNYDNSRSRESVYRGRNNMDSRYYNDRSNYNYDRRDERELRREDRRDERQYDRNRDSYRRYDDRSYTDNKKERGLFNKHRRYDYRNDRSRYDARDNRYNRNTTVNYYNQPYQGERNFWDATLVNDGNYSQMPEGAMDYDTWMRYRNDSPQYSNPSRQQQRNDNDYRRQQQTRTRYQW